MICESIPAPHYLFFSEGLPSLLYYSHFTAIIVALAIGALVIYKGHKLLLNKLLFSISVLFSLWSLFNLQLWVSNNSSVIFFFWSLFGILYGLISVMAVYFIYVFLTKQDISFRKKAFMFLIVLPIVVLAPTTFNLNGFDFELCGASGYENVYYLSYYTIVGIISMVWIAGILFKHYRKNNSISKKQIVLVGAGIEFFLLSFLVTSFLASYLNDLGLVEDYSLEFYGLFGMIVFLAILGYSIVKFKLFNIKVIGANAMVFALWVLIGSLLFIEDILALRIIISITLIAAIILGYLLINAVRNEVGQRVHIEKLAGDLKKANTRLLELDKQKSEFVSFATHQLRAPLTAMKGYTSLILEGEMGATTNQVREAVGRIYDSSKTLTNIVDDYLNISRIELGTMKYSFEVLNLKDLVESVIGELKPNIDRSGLAFAFSQVPADPKERFMVHADKDKLKQVVANLIDNSVKYTPNGSLEVGLLKSTSDRKIIFSVKDTGVGIAPAVMPKLFQKFIRADNANKQNIYGTGLGLFVAKEIVSAHKGRIWAESDGEGKGSTFYLELEMAV